MGDSWRELVKDPIVADLRVILDGGLYGFSVDNLATLPTTFGTGDTAAIRNRLLSLLMVDDPGLPPHDSGLGQSTRFNLALFGVTADTKMLTATGRRMRAGEIYRPANPVSADGVRKRPSARQPRGGPEWRLLASLREQVLASSATPRNSGHRPRSGDLLAPSVASALGRSWRHLNHLLNSRPANADPIPADIRDAIHELSQPIDYILHTLLPRSTRR